jgi:hypothetical protein
MPLTADTIFWARPRVQNFSEDFATKYIRALVSLDGQEFDKVKFFQTLIEEGAVGQPKIAAGKTVEEVYAKRWDSYLAPIRPFGLGFNVDEKRQQSPNPARKIWRASNIARMYDDGDISHDQFMALQLARTQFPKVTMPLQAEAEAQLRNGAKIQPLRLFIEVTDQLRAAQKSAHLTHEEVAQLARCHTHSNVGDVVAEIVTRRAGGSAPNWSSADPQDIDILLNDLDATGYFRRLSTVARSEPVIVPSLAVLNEGRALVEAVPWIDVTTDAGVEAYYERINAAPSTAEWSILNRDIQALVLQSGSYSRSNSRLTGAVDLIGGLAEEDPVFLQDEGRLYKVTGEAESSRVQGGRSVCTATIELVAYTP